MKDFFDLLKENVHIPFQRNAHSLLTYDLPIAIFMKYKLKWKMHDRLSIYLGPGDLSLHMMDACAESTMSLPLGYYEGIAISVDFTIFKQQTPEILNDAGIDGEQLYEKFCKQGKHTAMPANAQIDHIFSELYALPPHMQMPYFKLKVQELLLLRDTGYTMAEIAEQTGYESQSKFTAAFKDIFQMLPTAYRKQHQTT